MHRRQNLTYERYPYINPFYRIPPRRRFRERGRGPRSFFSYNPPTIPRQVEDSDYFRKNQLSEAIVTELTHTYKDLIDKFGGPNYLKEVKQKAKSEQILYIHTGANYTRTTTVASTQEVTTMANIQDVTTIKT